MSSTRCPLSYDWLPEGTLYTPAGLRRLHPRLEVLHRVPFTSIELRREAQVRMTKMSIQGVQPKVSAHLNLSKGTIEVVDRNGVFILKPAISDYPNVPENEDVTMRMAAVADLDVPAHGLIRLANDDLCYIIRRFDRYSRNRKRRQEDFAQLTGRSRDTKYNASVEQVIQSINTYCTFPVIDRMKLFRRILFSFLCGNEDAHLKNYSVLDIEGVISLSPVYDLLNTTIVLTNPVEESALPLNGKKFNFKATDFLRYLAVERLGLSRAAIDQVLHAFQEALPKWHQLLDSSFLPESIKESYHELLRDRSARLGI